MTILLFLMMFGAAALPFHKNASPVLEEAPSIFQIDLLPTNPIEFPSAAMLAAQSIPHLTPTPADPSLLFIIDFTDFMCPACLDSLLHLCRLLPRHIQ
ncbi:MAG: hypothetical protein WBB73_17570, partial [Candidatus Aminicenantaceae bacterium]